LTGRPDIPRLSAGASSVSHIIIPAKAGIQNSEHHSRDLSGFDGKRESRTPNVIPAKAGIQIVSDQVNEL